MKKILLFTFSTFLCLSTMNAQIVFQQDFEDGMAPMTIVDVDGFTPAANVANYADAWTTAIANSENGTNIAVSNSWYVPANTADDWMITPALEITNDITVLQWEAMAPDADYPDGYTVLISTTDAELASFTDEAFSVGGEASEWTDHSVSLAAYNGMTIFIAFRNNSTDQFLLYVDNIVVRAPTAVEGTLVSSGDALQVIDAPGQTKSFDFTFANTGTSDVTSFDFVYSIDGGADMTITSAETIAVGESGTITVEDLTEGSHQIIATINNINGTDNNTNSVTYDVIVEVPVPNYIGTDVHGNDFNLHDVLTEGKVVILDFFASWCGPCETSTPILNTAWENLGSGAEDFQVFGLTVEPEDDDAAVLGLGWGANYPKFSYVPRNDYFFSIYDAQFGSGGIPLFIMICPDTEHPGFSSISWSKVGINNFSAAEIESEAGSCLLTIPTNNVAAEYGVNIFPNPVNEFTNVAFNLPSSENVKISVVNTLGQVVSTKNLGVIAAGEHTELIDMNQQAAGIYQILIQFGDKMASNKISVIK